MFACNTKLRNNCSSLFSKEEHNHESNVSHFAIIFSESQVNSEPDEDAGLHDKDFLDVTLASHDEQIQAHILSANFSKAQMLIQPFMLTKPNGKTAFSYDDILDISKNPTIAEYGPAFLTNKIEE